MKIRQALVIYTLFLIFISIGCSVNRKNYNHCSTNISLGKYYLANYSFVKDLKKEKKYFGKGMTGNVPNALPMNRRNQGSGFSRKYVFMHPGHKGYYKGRRDRLGLYNNY